MPLTETLKEIDYPESDGQPMGETQLHQFWMVRIQELLRFRYRNQQVLIASDLLMYFVEGDPRTFLVPDVFLVKDCDPGFRNTFQTWREQRVPNVIFEVTSKSTRRNDQEVKPKTYAEIGVNEVILFDPTSDYLDPPLQLFRRVGCEFVRQEADSDGRLISEELDAILFLEDDQLVLLDRLSQRPLLTEAESEFERAEAEARRAETEARRAEVEAGRAEAEAGRAEAEAERAEAESCARGKAEAEAERLRGILRQHGLSD